MTSELLARARASLEAARLLLDNGYPDFATSRAYFTMFYLTEAYLDREGLSFSKHSAVIGEFGRLFAATGRVPKEIHRALIEAQELRNAGDYGAFPSVTAEEARQILNAAESFLRLAEEQLGDR